ncbi:Mucin-associated surface protein (MASP), subgroup S074 [Trypanosoma cruzi]|nr:Mucin-associated surface protein (MASP), subgroup S074 [Trypanosoma cruzi]
MAMMMTGRVLLVCALCVLWCVTVFGDARDNRCVEGDGNVLTHTHNGGNDRVRLKADFGLISTRMGLIKAVEAGEREGEDLENGHDSLENEDKSPQGGEPAGIGGNEAPVAGGEQGAAGAGAPSLPVSGPGVPGAGGENSQSLMAGQEGNEKNKVDPGSKEPKESQDQTTDQLPSSSGSTSTPSGEKHPLMGTSDINQLPTDTETKGDADLQDKNGSDEAIEEEDGDKDKEKKQEKNTLLPETQEGQNNGGGTPPSSGGPAPSISESEGSPLPDQENLQNQKKVKNEATHSGPKMETKAPEPPSGVATQGQHRHDTDTEVSTKNAAAGSPAEPTTSSTSASGSGDHVQNKADKDDAQSSEGQHDSLETGNTNVVPTLSEAAPQTAKTTTAAQTNDTATPDDSDGSTAVSHTTSPLLLLIVVACAAAAVVVAA